MENKSRRNKQGFTLMEMMVVILIIAVLTTIAMPVYRVAVEKARATQGITSLTQIAKAQKTYNAKRGEYADNMLGLSLEMKDSEGSNVTGAEFSDQYFDYKIFGDEFERARATRNTGEYELSVDYGTGEVFCRPIEHKICQQLNLKEGRTFELPWEDCAGQLDSWWSNNFNASGPKESKTTSCQLRIDTKADTMDFDFCIPKGSSFSLFSRVATNGECFKGRVLGNNQMEYCAYRTDNPNQTCMYAFIEKKDENSCVYMTRERYNMVSQTFESTTGNLVFYNFNSGGSGATATCNEFDTNNACVRYTCRSGDCSIFDN